METFEGGWKYNNTIMKITEVFFIFVKREGKKTPLWFWTLKCASDLNTCSATERWNLLTYGKLLTGNICIFRRQI